MIEGAFFPSSQDGPKKNKERILKEQSLKYKKEIFVNVIDDKDEPGGSRFKDSDVFIIKKELVNKESSKSSGAFGVVYDVDLQLPGSEKTYHFVLKEMHGSGEQAEEKVDNAINNFLRAKQAGLRVWTTYRMSEDGKSILMTTGNMKGWKVLQSQRVGESLPKMNPPSMNNFKSLLVKYYGDAVKAATNKISIAADVPFFLVQEDSIDFVLGDLDLLEKSDQDPKKMLRQNLQNLHAILTRFFEDNYKGEADQFIEESKKYIQKQFDLIVRRYGGDINANDDE